MRTLASWLFLALAGCQLVSGIASYEVDGGGAGGGSEGGGGTERDFGPLCDDFCDLAKEPALQCGDRACYEQVCHDTLLLDFYPECHATAFDYGTCVMKRPASEFTCVNGLPNPIDGVCAEKGASWIDCLADPMWFENTPDACGEACEGPFNGLCGAAPPVCTQGCINKTQPGEPCAGLWAGLAHCAAENSADAWYCYDVLGVQFAGPVDPSHDCYFVYATLAACIQLEG